MWIFVIFSRILYLAVACNQIFIESQIFFLQFKVKFIKWKVSRNYKDLNIVTLIMMNILNTKKYHVFAPMGRFQLESIYLYFPPSSQLLYYNIIYNYNIIAGTMVENKGKLILHENSCLIRTESKFLFLHVGVQYQTK